MLDRIQDILTWMNNLGDVAITVNGFTIGVLAVLLAAVVRITVVSSERRARCLANDAELIFQQQALNSYAIVNISDAEGQITSVNDNFVNATGYSENEIIGKSIDEFFMGGTEARFDNVLACLATGKTWTGETELVRRQGGKTLWTQTTILPLLDDDGNLLKTMSVRIDTTESKAADHEDQLRATFDLLNDEVFVFSTESLELICLNKQALKVLGWTATDYIGKTLADTDSSFDIKAFKTRTAPLINGQERSLVFESNHNGRWVEVNLQLYHPLNDKPRFVAVVRDIERRKEAERAKAEFVATISHELRSPLTSIKGALKLITSGATGELAPKSMAMLDIALRNTDRLVLLINDILDLERLDAGMLKLDLEQTDLARLIKESITEIAPFGLQYGVTFRCNGTMVPFYARVDKARLMQVMINLLSNAAKFSPQGGVVEVSLEQTESAARISVKDCGTGIPKEAHATIFDRFTQAESPAQRNVVGTGLGLSIVKAIVEKHRGTISFESEVNRGTTFYFDIPLQRQARTAA